MQKTTIGSIEEVIRRVKDIDYEEARRESEDYLELVVTREALRDLHFLLESYFGPAFKPAGQDACRLSEGRSRWFGGVKKDQILYYTERENVPAVALIWPWNDGRRATLKIAQGPELNT
jgi:hypothetical protein